MLRESTIPKLETANALLIGQSYFNLLTFTRSKASNNPSPYICIMLQSLKFALIANMTIFFSIKKLRTSLKLLRERLVSKLHTPSAINRIKYILRLSLSMASIVEGSWISIFKYVPAEQRRLPVDIPSIRQKTVSAAV